MGTLFKEVKYNLQTLIQQIDMGIVGLPDIQRPFVWDKTKVRDLFDSMYKGYPVGYLLFWQNANIENTKTIGSNNKQLTPNLLIVDGQQRLTSLFAVIKGVNILNKDFKKEKIIISFKPLTQEFVIPDAATKRSAEYIQNISDLFDPSTNIFAFTNEFISKLKLSREKENSILSYEDEAQIQNSISNLKSLDAYPFSVLELSAEIDEEQVADIFVRINSQGKKLNNADFVLTLMSVFWDEGRFALEDFCRQSRIPNPKSSNPFNYLIEPYPDDMLRVSIGLGFERAVMQSIYNILRGKDLQTGDFSEERRDEQFKILKDAQEKTLNIQTWHEFIKTINSVGYLDKDVISSKNALIFSYILFLVGKHKFNIEHFQLRKVVGKWFFVSSLTARYSGSSESQMEFDLSKIRNLADGNEYLSILNNTIDTLLTNDYWEITLPNELATSSSRNPGQLAYYASLVILDANGLFSNIRVSDLLREGIRSSKSPLEKHHLFPKKYLEGLGYDQTLRNQVANYALVEWNDNIDISDDAPKIYIEKYLKRFNKKEIEQMYHLHALPDSWASLDYSDFLDKRRKLIAGVIRDAYKKISLN